jgi:hypothetical protein
MSSDKIPAETPIHFITYADDNYMIAKNRLLKQAAALNTFATCTGYSPVDLDENFQAKCQILLSQRKGAGYWCWKPYIVLKRLHTIPDDEWIFYADAGCSFVPERKGQIKEFVYMMMHQHKSLFAYQMSQHAEEQYTKADMFTYFDLNPGLAEDASVCKTGQYVGGIFFAQNKPAVRRLFAGMVKIMISNPELIDDSPSNAHESEQFKDHRHDQSLFSIARKLEPQMVFVTEDTTYFGPSFIHATRTKT